MRARSASLRTLVLLIALEPTTPGLPASPAPAAPREPATGAAAVPGSLRWPLDLAPAIVSTFGEYRYDHLHAGIDISTGGAVGLKVRAAADGTIVRLKVEWRGYGRALYLRHADGRTTVYGHLQQYEDVALGLERLVARRQRVAGTRYPGDIYLDPPIAVRRGQVIAYSGESGVGLPHLHFEVRGSADQPIDPFRSGLRPLETQQAPVMDALIVTAAAPDAYIDGVRRDRRYALRLREGLYGMDEPVRVTGPFEATLDAYDPAGGGRAGVRGVEVTVDGRPYYRFSFDTFRFDQYPISGLIHDHRESHLGPTRFGYRLSPLPGNALAADLRPAGSPADAVPGAFDLSDGPHRLEIVVTSARGRASRARMAIVMARPEPAQSPAASPPPDAARPPTAQPSLQLEFFPRFIDLAYGAARPAASGAGAATPACAGEPIIVRPRGESMMGGGLSYPRAAQMRKDVGAGGPDCLASPGLASLLIEMTDPSRPAALAGSGFRVELPAGGRFFPGPLAARALPPNDLPAGLAGTGNAVDILPEGEALNAAGTIAFDLPEGGAEALGIFRFDAVTGRWSYEGDSLETADSRMLVAFRRYGRFALLRDNAPPVVSDVRPGNGSRPEGRRPEVSATIEEIGKGIGYDGVSFELDGALLESEFDPDRGTARPFAVPLLKPGTHHLRVVARDRAGNESKPVLVEFDVR